MPCGFHPYTEDLRAQRRYNSRLQESLILSVFDGARLSLPARYPFDSLVRSTTSSSTSFAVIPQLTSPALLPAILPAVLPVHLFSSGPTFDNFQLNFSTSSIFSITWLRLQSAYRSPEIMAQFETQIKKYFRRLCGRLFQARLVPGDHPARVEQL